MNDPSQAKQAAIVVDSFDEFSTYAYTEEKIGWLMDMFARTGFGRVYWYTYVPHTGYMRQGEKHGSFLRQSLRHVPNHEQLATQYAHAHGLEIYAVYKPYEEALGYCTTGLGTEGDAKHSRLERIDGQLMHASDFLRKHARLRVKRRQDDIPDDIDTRIINRIEIDSTADKLAGLTRDDIRVYLSKDNASYTLYEGAWTFNQAVVEAITLDYFGRQLNTDSGRTCRIVLDRLDIDPRWRFVAVSAADKRDRFQFIPKTMCRVYDQQGREIPATYAHHRAQRKAGSENHTDHGFAQHGFHFDVLNREMGISSMYLTTTFCSLEIGITRGVNEYLPGVLCEAYPEVRAYWMARVQGLLDVGVDGIDIRLSNHCGYSQDPFAFGFNEVVLKEYRKREGSDDIACDPIKLMRLRGDLFTEFLAEAASAIRTAGKHVQAHVIAPYATGDIYAMANHTHTSIWPDWEKWVRDIVDAVTFRDFQCRYYHPEIGRTIKRFARRLGKEVWMPCYIQMADGNLNETFLKQIQQDDDVTGVLFYQSTSTYEEKNGRFEFLPQYEPLLRQFIEANR